MLNDLYQSFVFLSHSVFAKIYCVKKTCVIYNPRHDIGPKSNIWKDRFDATGKKYIYTQSQKSYNVLQRKKFI